MNRLSLYFRSVAFTALLLTAFLYLTDGADAQTTPQRVFESGGRPNVSNVPQFSAFDKTSGSGDLAGVTGSPFAALEAGPIAVDGKGQFLFLAGQSSIHMYSIDQASGALSEVPRSPFPYIPYTVNGPPPAGPLSIVTEPTGKYVYVGFATGSLSGMSTITSYDIDISDPSSPVLDLGGNMDIPEQPTYLFVDPTGRHFYRALGTTTNGHIDAGIVAYDLDASSGGLFEVQEYLTGENPRSSAMDSQGRFLYSAFGQFEGWISSLAVDSTTGKLALVSSFYLGVSAFVTDLTPDPSGKFLYAFLDLGNSTYPRGYYIFPIDQAGNFGQPTYSPNLPLGQVTVADPQGPYMYTVNGAKLQGFQVDANSGTLTELAGSPFTDGSSANSTEAVSLYITNTQPQAASGPYLELTSSGSFPATNVGQTSSTTVTVYMTNIGNQSLSFTSIALTGDSSNSFMETNNCPAALASGAGCQANISFTPTVAGALSAALQITSNAPGSPQGLGISGTGISTATFPQATFSPSSILSGSQTQGTTGTAQTITLSNSGNAPLHVSGISLAGSFPADWSQSNNCKGAAVAPQASCTISVVFAPSDNGILTALMNVADDAPNSPQVINIYGNAPPAAQIVPSTVAGSTSSSVSAGQTAMFNLQVTPNAGFTGMMSFTCSGAPTGAHCNTPSSFMVSNGMAAPFAVSVSTSGSAAFLPPGIRNIPSRKLPEIFLLSLLLCLLIAARLKALHPEQIHSRPALGWRMALASLALFLALSGCGGGGSTTTNPPPVITPSGTYIITVIPSASAAGSSKALALTPIQLSLTVK